MAIELCVLASGSGGNCTVVRAPRGVMLIDAGIGPRIAATRMNGTGIRVADVSAICLTHLDRDHFGLSWVSTVVRHGLICRTMTFNGNSIAAVRAKAESPLNERNRIGAKFCPASSKEKLSALR